MRGVCSGRGGADAPVAAGLQRSRGARVRRGFRTAARELAPHPPAGQTRVGALRSEVFIPDKRGKKTGPLRQLNFCHVSLFLLKGVITAIQLQ